LSELGPQTRAYREAWAAAGHPGKGQIFLRVPVYIAETAERARSEPEASVMHFYRYLGQRIEQSATSAGGRGIAGVGERLSGLRAELGLDGILAELNCGGQIPREQMMTSLQLLCEDVIPRFKDA